MINVLENVYDRKKNIFNDIRFILATMVLYMHCYPLLYGKSGWKDFFTYYNGSQIGLATIAVYLFFVLSGFFMIQSLENSSSFFNYMKKRLLRLLPAFWLSLGLTAFILAPIISNALIFSLDKGSALYFFLNAGTFHFFDYSWSITGLFTNNPWGNGVNGSMWTLKHELALYIFLPFVVWLSFKNRKVLIVTWILLLILSLSNIFANFQLFTIPCCKAWVLSKNEYNSFIVFAFYFFSGVVYYKFKEYVVISNRLIFVSIALFAIGFFYGNLKIISLIVLPYLVISIGVKFNKILLSKTGDYSYGLYIYAFPIQQTLIHFFKRDFTLFTFFLSAFFITLVLSVLSWHFVEKKFLSLK